MENKVLMEIILPVDMGLIAEVLKTVSDYYSESEIYEDIRVKGGVDTIIIFGTLKEKVV